MKEKGVQESTPWGIYLIKQKTIDSLYWWYPEFP